VKKTAFSTDRILRYGKRAGEYIGAATTKPLGGSSNPSQVLKSSISESTAKFNFLSKGVDKKQTRELLKEMLLERKKLMSNPKIKAQMKNRMKQYGYMEKNSFLESWYNDLEKVAIKIPGMRVVHKRAIAPRLMRNTQMKLTTTKPKGLPDKSNYAIELGGIEGRNEKIRYVKDLKSAERKNPSKLVYTLNNKEPGVLAGFNPSIAKKMSKAPDAPKRARRVEGKIMTGPGGFDGFVKSHKVKLPKSPRQREILSRSALMHELAETKVKKYQPFWGHASPKIISEESNLMRSIPNSGPATNFIKRLRSGGEINSIKRVYPGFEYGKTKLSPAGKKHINRRIDEITKHEVASSKIQHRAEEVRNLKNKFAKKRTEAARLKKKFTRMNSQPSPKIRSAFQRSKVNHV